jgi:hypothetical protein
MSTFTDLAKKYQETPDGMISEEKIKETDTTITTEKEIDPTEFVRREGYVIKSEEPTKEGVVVEFYKKTDASKALDLLKTKYKKYEFVYDGIREIEIKGK